MNRNIMNKILFYSNEFFILWNFPKEPKILTVNARVEYEKVVKACIAAKTRIDTTSVVNTLKLKWVIKNSNETIWAYDDHILIDDGKIFDLPENVEFEESTVYKCENKRCSIPGRCLQQGKPTLCEQVSEKVIHLKLKQEQTNDEIEEESQDDLIVKLWWTYFPQSNISQTKIDRIKSKFNIQRNKI